MKAKFFVIDFINFIFALIFGFFAFFYFMSGNHLYQATEFFTELSKFSLFALLFLIIFKKNAKKAFIIKSEEKKSDYFQIIKYLMRKDEITDWMYIFILPIIILLLAYFLSDVDKIDWLQAFVVFYIAAMVHKFFLKKKNEENRNFLTNADKLIDEIMIYSLPLVIYTLAMIAKDTNKVDFVQAITVLLISYVWHYFFFKPRR